MQLTKNMNSFVIYILSVEEVSELNMFTPDPQDKMMVINSCGGMDI